MDDASNFLSCDWGTTSFRLRLVHGSNHRIIRELQERAGVKTLYEQALREGNSTEQSRADVFSRFLNKQLERLSEDVMPGACRLPLIISGMASSSIGWWELPYAQAPFDLDGNRLRFEELKWDSPPWVGPTYLLSGVATPHDIMRGEEMEIVGLMSEPGLAAARERCLLILPGTHSKHVWIKNGSVIDFRTAMTGELFEVLGRHSLLRASVDLQAPEAAPPSQTDLHAFREGVLWAKERGLTGGLFRVRTRTVLDRCSSQENTSFFSGLLIGAELRYLLEADDHAPVILGAAGSLSRPYATALGVLFGNSKRWIQVPPEQVERATVSGHAAFFRTTRSPAS